MARVVKALKTIRNNWKKSIFFFGAALYGVRYGVDKYNTFQLMRAYCEEALQYGELMLPKGGRPRHITVILNPAANRRTSKKNFEKYCAPMLHLAGICVDIIQTEFEGQARGLVESLDSVVDAIVVAGGDGTASETVTGLLRRADGDLALQRKFPIGILPLGRTNTVARSLFMDSNNVKMMAEATMAIIKEVTKPIDVIKIEVLETETDIPGKPVYCLGGIQWGAYRDAHAKRDKYWYWGVLRSYVSYIFMGMKGEKAGMSWQCEGHLNYVLPCKGCSKCKIEEKSENSSYRWWHVFIPKHTSASGNAADKDYSNVINEQCGTNLQKEISTVDLNVTTANTSPKCIRDGDPHIQVALGPPSVGYTEFVSEGWRRENGEMPCYENILEVRELELRPVLKETKSEDQQQWISIDNEDYEVKPIHATLLPKKVHVFCKPADNIS
ncbi:acylglycerol kinase, mitochondrial [Periplaneta americana]|uniref:acylglycerol kinase, mitochondrial n=1 Tax=Periplaneta americana TaxID=6978 RepID=UPI0037E97899